MRVDRTYISWNIYYDRGLDLKREAVAAVVWLCQLLGRGAANGEVYNDPNQNNQLFVSRDNVAILAHLFSTGDFEVDKKERERKWAKSCLRLLSCFVQQREKKTLIFIRTWVVVRTLIKFYTFVNDSFKPWQGVVVSVMNPQKHQFRKMKMLLILLTVIFYSNI